jgi:nucleoside-diphosphate-sugar epimerase
LTGPVAITGASGRVGAPLMQALLRAGRHVRALSRRPQPHQDGVEWVRGDLLDSRAVASLVAGSDTVFHAGGQLAGPPDEIQRSLVEGTANVLRAARHARVVHISSLVVLDTGSPKSPRLIDETCPLEAFPDRRGSYTRAKYAAEALARSAAIDHDVIVVRPGLVMNAGHDVIPPSIGLRVGPCVVFVGPRHARLPVVHADDLAVGLLFALTAMRRGEILHLVDPMPVTRAALLHRISAGMQLRVGIPAGTAVLMLARRAAVSRQARMADAAYRLLSAGAPHDWSAERATAIGWRPGALAAWFGAQAP